VENSNFVYVRGSAANKSVWDKNHKNILGGLEVHPIWDGETNVTKLDTHLITVHDVE